MPFIISENSAFKKYKNPFDLLKEKKLPNMKIMFSENKIKIINY